VRFYTVHLRQGSPPVLVAEGFSWGAAIFGPIWLLAHRAWVPAALALAVAVLIGVFAPPAAAAAFGLAFVWLLGLFGRDLVGWSLERRGYRLAHVVAARDAEAAYGRLLAARPDLAAAALA
jgi:uncharacterized protein DUF2628